MSTTENKKRKLNLKIVISLATLLNINICPEALAEGVPHHQARPSQVFSMEWEIRINAVS